MPAKPPAAAADADADLADLLPGDNEKVPLTNASLDALSASAGPRQSSGGICALISAHLSYLCFAYPTCCGCFACIMMFVCVTALVSSMVNPNQTFGVVQHDWTTVSSVYELDVGKIDHWCLGGGNEGCRCEDPLVPASRAELRSWTEAYKDNKRMIDRYMEDPLLMADLDVAIVGESAIEEMDGRWLGRFRNDELKNIGTIFKNHFNKDKGAQVEGVALGIAGDSAGNVLWRLIHGEMADGFNPKIWWVSLGMNDLTRQQCSEEVVVLGVLRVVEEILKRRPKARVVINSLLPMADLRGGTVVTEKDYRDAFSSYRGKRARGNVAHYVRKNVNGKETIERVPKGPGGKRHHKHRNNRRLLERALEAYNAKKNDNSEEIERLQRKLQEEILGDTMPENEEDYDNLVQRRLQDDIPKRYRKDKYNPTLDREKYKQKKYNFFRKRRMPLWTSIYTINKQLFKFCEKHEQVDFFDATNIFAERKSDVGQKYFTLLSDNISARGHPTALGYLKWEDAMVKKTLHILEEMKKEQPEMFLHEPTGPGLGDGGSLGGGGIGATAVERVEKKPFVEDNRGEDNMMEPQDNSDGEPEEGEDEDAVDNEGADGGDAEEGVAEEVEAEDEPQEEDTGEKEEENEPEDESEGQDEQAQVGMMQQQGMQQNGMMMQPGMQQNGMMMQQPGMPQNGMMMQPGMQQNGMMMQQQPGMPQNGMMMQPGMQQNGMMMQPGMQQNGMMMQQQPGIPEDGTMQQPGMPQNGMMMQQQPAGDGTMQQPGMPQNGMMMQQQPGEDGTMQQPGMPQNGMMQPPGMQQNGMMQPGMMQQPQYTQGNFNQMQQAPMQGNYQMPMQGMQSANMQGMQYQSQPQGTVPGDPTGMGGGEEQGDEEDVDTGGDLDANDESEGNADVGGFAAMDQEAAGETEDGGEGEQEGGETEGEDEDGGGVGEEGFTDADEEAGGGGEEQDETEGAAEEEADNEVATGGDESEGGEEDGGKIAAEQDEDDDDEE